MQQLMHALVARRDGLAVEATVGHPYVFHDSISQAQAMQKNLYFGVHMEMDETNLQVKLGHVDCDEGDFHSLHAWRYTHLWRPLDHLCAMHFDVVLYSTYH